MAVTNQEIVNCAAPIHLSAGLPGGVEATVHSMRKLQGGPKVVTPKMQLIAASLTM